MPISTLVERFACHRGIGMKIENNQYPKYVSQINMDLANHNVAKREEKTESKRDTV